MDREDFTSKFTPFNLKLSLRFLTHLFPGLVFPAFFLLLGGCASVSVGNIHDRGTPPRKLPSKIYVREFVAPYDDFRVDRNGESLKAFIKGEQHALASGLVAQLTKYIAPAVILSEGKPLPKGNYWLVTGTYDRVNQGSRALRTLVGFGAGGTKLETRVQISNLSGKGETPFLSMLTTGGSGVAPGAWAAFTPAMVFYWPGAIANAGGASLAGLSVDRNRTAREITATLSEYCFQHGLITERRTHRPKKLGMLPSIQRPDFVIPKSGP
jgi:hypothetical protein